MTALKKLDGGLAGRRAVEELPLNELRIDQRIAAALPRPVNYEAIRDDVARQGIVLPLLVTEDDLLLDGHMRTDIARELGLRAVPVLRLPIKAGDEGWDSTIALALALHRRHLNDLQRVALGTSMEKRERIAAEARARAGKAIPDTPVAVPPQGSGRVSAVMAKRVGVPEKTYTRAKAILTKAPADVRHAALRGELTVAAAYAATPREPRAPKPGAKPPVGDEQIAVRLVPALAARVAALGKAPAGLASRVVPHTPDAPAHREDATPSEALRWLAEWFAPPAPGASLSQRISTLKCALTLELEDASPALYVSVAAELLLGAAGALGLTEKRAVQDLARSAQAIAAPLLTDADRALMAPQVPT